MKLFKTHISPINHQQVVSIKITPYRMIAYSVLKNTKSIQNFWSLPWKNKLLLLLFIMSLVMGLLLWTSVDGVFNNVHVCTHLCDICNCLALILYCVYYKLANNKRNKLQMTKTLCLKIYCVVCMEFTWLSLDKSSNVCSIKDS